MAEGQPGGLKHILAGFKGLFISKQVEVNLEAPDQKRKLTRIRCEYRVQCMAEGKPFSGMVVDMGLGGMRMKLTRLVKAGSALSVKYESLSTYMAEKKFNVDTVNTEVVWCHKKPGTATIEAAVKYTDPEEVMGRSWVKFILKQLGFESHGIKERRKDVRLKAVMAADVKPDGTQVEGQDGVIVNLGAGGCLFESTMETRLYSRLQLHISSLAGLKPLTCMGTVVQVRKIPDKPRWALGIRFENLRPDQVRLLGRYLAALIAATDAE